MRILIPTDFSRLSDFATIMADKLKALEDVEVHFLHVVDWTEPELDSEGKPHAAEGEDPKALAEHLQNAQNEMDRLKTKRPEDSFQILFGPRTKTLVEYAESNHFDMIIMGTKGATGLGNWLSGTETQHIARQSNIPVLSLMCDRSDLEIKDILIVHDFLNKGTVDLPVLKLLEKGFGATIHFLYVSTTEMDAEKIHEKMDDFAKVNGLNKIVQHIHADRDVSSGVTHFNQMNDMDMIIIGTEGRRGLGRLLKSSVAEKLINNLYKPIITYHIK